jgi:hypothetical protein
MNRRDILKAIATLPFTGTLAHSRESQKAPSQSKNERAHTLQILLEGPFALVLQKGKTDRLTAFVPRAEERDLAHDFYFNDPITAKQPLLKESTGYLFQLSDVGLRRDSDPYINPGLGDFTAETEKWHLAERVVTLELPFPNSINFTGKPLRVKFTEGERKGRMATNFVLEYYVENPDKAALMCPQLQGKCTPSPNCPPGIIRYFFGVAPHDKGDSQKHAREFFNNVLLHKFFPELEKRYSIAYIEPSFRHQHQESPAGTAKPTKGVFDLSSSPRFLTVGAVLDCDLGGITVTTSSGPTG